MDAQPWKPDLDAVTRDDLPPGFREVADVIGLPDTLALVVRRGGTRLTIPRRLRADHPISQALNPAAARKIAAHFAGEKLNIPTFNTITRRQRDSAIRAAFDDGARVHELVARFGIGDRQIWEILGGGSE